MLDRGRGVIPPRARDGHHVVSMIVARVLPQRTVKMTERGGFVSGIQGDGGADCGGSGAGTGFVGFAAVELCAVARTGLADTRRWAARPDDARFFATRAGLRAEVRAFLVTRRDFAIGITKDRSAGTVAN